MAAGHVAAGEREIRRYTVTIAAGTPVASPQVTALAMPPRAVRAVTWRVPKGHQGLTGWRLTMSGVQVLPTPGTDQWVTTDNAQETWDIREFPDSGAWQVTAYNLGNYPHSVFLTFHVEHAGRVPEPPSLISPALLSDFPGEAADLWPAGIWG
jgi:hypothetical protein